MASLRTVLALEGENRFPSHPRTTTVAAAAVAAGEHKRAGAVRNIKKQTPNLPSSEWSSDAVAVLLKSYSEKFALGKGSLRGKDWEEVLADVNALSENTGSAKTMKQCKDKIDTLKRRYKIEKHRVIYGNAVTWPFFAQLDNMMASVLRQGKTLDPCGTMPSPAASEFHEDSTTHPKKDSLQKATIPVEEDAMGNPSLSSMHRHPQSKQLYRDVVDESVKLEHVTTGNCEKVESRKRNMTTGERLIEFSNVDSGFSHVAARIEAAKMHIVSQIKFEMAQLRRMKRRKKQWSS